MSFPDETRREALKIMGAIGGTCAFPFASNELYGQDAPPQQVHQHAGPPQRPPVIAGPVRPGYFSENDFAVISRMAELIIPKTDTPGAIEAGVPLYIDAVVGASKPLQQLCQAALTSDDLAGFGGLSESRQIAVLTKLDTAYDTEPARFFHLIKSLTADGYYTSYTGLIEELGYSGNTVLARFPVSELPEH